MLNCSLAGQVSEVGRSLFLHHPNHTADLSEPGKQSGVEVCQGYKQTLHVVEAGLTVTADLSFSTFVKPMGAVDYLVAKSGLRDARELEHRLRSGDQRLQRVLTKEVK